MYIDFLIFAIIILSLVISSLISGSEVAFFSLNSTQIKDFRTSNNGNDKIVLALLSKPKKLLANILIINNLCNITIVILSTIYTWSILDPDNNFLIFLMALLFTFIIVFFGEIIPKIWAKNHNSRFATTVAPTLNLLFSLTNPLTIILVFINSKLEKYFKDNTKLPIESIIQAVEIVAENKTTDEKIQDIWLKHAATFSSKTVGQIMRYRIHIKTLDIKTSFYEVIKYIKKWGYSRIPVYEDTIDDIKGVLYIKDVLKYIDENENFEWQQLINPNPIFVSQNKNINELLNDFQVEKTHIALVVDEFGGTLGLVTMEDIVEEIIGEIDDEFYNMGTFYKKINANTFIFESYTLLNDFCKVLHIQPSIFDDVSKDVESLGGLMSEIVATLPKKGDTIPYKYFLFIIEEADKKKINKIKVQLIKSLL